MGGALVLLGLVVGVQLGSVAGLRIGARLDSRWLEALLSVVLFGVGILMLQRAR